MSIALVVVHPFADHAKGDRITDADQVKKILATNPTAVVKIAGDAPPAPQAEAPGPAPSPDGEAS